jgi:hypothetical protein
MFKKITYQFGHYQNICNQKTVYYIFGLPIYTAILKQVDSNSELKF